MQLPASDRAILFLGACLPAPISSPRWLRAASWSYRASQPLWSARAGCSTRTSAPTASSAAACGGARVDAKLLRRGLPPRDALLQSQSDHVVVDVVGRGRGPVEPVARQPFPISD
eukprot:scaffold6110_cov118-Isochrysis_galbana.AAC.6